MKDRAKLVNSAPVESGLHSLELVLDRQDSGKLSLVVTHLLGVVSAHLLRDALLVLSSTHLVLEVLDRLVQHAQLLVDLLQLHVHVDHVGDVHEAAHVRANALGGAAGGDLVRSADHVDLASLGERHDERRLGGQHSLVLGVVALHVHGRLLLVVQLVRGLHRTDALDHVLQERETLVDTLVGPARRQREVGDHDGDRLGRLTPRQPVPQLLGGEGQQGVQKAESGLEADKEAVLEDLLVLQQVRRSLAGHHGLRELEEVVAEVVQPEGVRATHRLREVVAHEGVVDGRHGVVQAGEDPVADEREVEHFTLLELRVAAALGQQCLRHLVDTRVLLPRQERRAGRREQRRHKRRLRRQHLHRHAVLDGVPQLVAEVAVRHNLLDVEVHVAARRGVREQTDPEGVAAALGNALIAEGLLLELHSPLHLSLRQVALQELVVEGLQGDATAHVKRVDDVAERLAHLASLLVAHHRVQVHGVERQLVQEDQRRHDHARHPEEQDVVASLEQLRREELLEVLVLRVGPAQGRVRQQTRREPGVKHILVPLQRQLLRVLVGELEQLLRLRAGLVLRPARHPVARVVLVQGLAVKEALVGGNAVAPPQLARNAPRVDVVEPVVPNLAVALRDQLELVGLLQVEGALGSVLALGEPLRHQELLHNVARALAASDGHRPRLLLHEKVTLLESLDDGGTRVVALHALELALHADVAGLVHHADLRQLVPLTALEIVGVVRGGDLDHTSSLRHVDDRRVQHDGDDLVTERATRVLAVKVLVPLVLGVDGDTSVTQDRLRTRRRDLQLLAGLVHNVLEVVHHTNGHLGVVARHLDLRLSGELFVLHLQVGDGRLQSNTPVHKTRAAHDDALLVELAEGFRNGGGTVVVHREELTAPVERRGGLLQLVVDGGGVRVLPLPHALDEGVTTEVVARQTLLALNLLLHNNLRGNARVVRARNPQHVLAAHPPPPHKRVLHGVRQGVSDVKRAGDVRGRQADAELAILLDALLVPLLKVGARAEEAGLLPPVVPPVLDGDRVIAARDLRGEILLAGSCRPRLRRRLRHI
eukprot:Rhum_TRINITY_DN3360_c0_g1::Rhum_TRINITY_DN3360_c0_g1_i1::g.10617::m.10617